MADSDRIKWSRDGDNILSAENLVAVKRYLKEKGNIAVEHWHYFGSRSQTPLAFDDYDEFIAYLQANVRPGDAIDVFPFPSNREALIATGKYPDSEGRVPEGGTY